MEPWRERIVGVKVSKKEGYAYVSISFLRAETEAQQEKSVEELRKELLDQLKDHKEKLGVGSADSMILAVFEHESFKETTLTLHQIKTTVEGFLEMDLIKLSSYVANLEIILSLSDTIDKETASAVVEKLERLEKFGTEFISCSFKTELLEPKLLAKFALCCGLASKLECLERTFSVEQQHEYLSALMDELYKEKKMLRHDIYIYFPHWKPDARFLMTKKEQTMEITLIKNSLYIFIDDKRTFCFEFRGFTDLALTLPEDVEVVGLDLKADSFDLLKREKVRKTIESVYLEWSPDNKDEALSLLQQCTKLEDYTVNSRDALPFLWFLLEKSSLQNRTLQFGGDVELTEEELIQFATLAGSETCWCRMVDSESDSLEAIEKQMKASKNKHVQAPGIVSILPGYISWGLKKEGRYILERSRFR